MEDGANTHNKSWPQFNTYLDFVPPQNATKIHLVSHHIQVLIISIIIIICVISNLVIITNIISCSIKTKIISFQLVKYLCIVDLLGAFTVLPIPLAATIQGKWSLGPNLCYINSLVTMVIWMEHMIMFAMLKVDRMMVSMLPSSKYPMFSVTLVKIIVLLTWVVSAMISFCINSFNKVAYEPAVLLCVPTLPKEVFLTAVIILIIFIILVIIGFLVAFILLKKKQGRVQDAVQDPQTSQSRTLSYHTQMKSLCSNFVVTMFQIILYVPTVLVVGLHGWILPPSLIIICDMIVYSEFMIHPVMLLTTSTKLREEISDDVKAKYAAFKRGANNLLCCNCPELEQQEENNNIDKPDYLSRGNIHIIQLRPTDAVMTADKGTMTSGHPDFSRLSPDSFNLTNSFALSSDRSNFEVAKPEGGELSH